MEVEAGNSSREGRQVRVMRRQKKARAKKDRWERFSQKTAALKIQEEPKNKKQTPDAAGQKANKLGRYPMENKRSRSQ